MFDKNLGFDNIKMSSKKYVPPSSQKPGTVNTLSNNFKEG